MNYVGILETVCFHFRIKVRGHNVFWAVDQWVPGWVKALSKQDLIQEESSRIKGVISHTKGL